MHDAEPAEVRVDRPVRPDPERAAFERWCGEDGRWPQAIERNGNGYKLMSTHSAWMAWRACWPQAQAAERERCAVLVETRDVSGHDGYIETSGDLLDALAGCIRRGA